MENKKQRTKKNTMTQSQNIVASRFYYIIVQKIGLHDSDDTIQTYTVCVYIYIYLITILLIKHMCLIIKLKIWPHVIEFHFINYLKKRKKKKRLNIFNVHNILDS